MVNTLHLVSVGAVLTLCAIAARILYVTIANDLDRIAAALRGDVQ